MTTTNLRYSKARHAIQTARAAGITDLKEISEKFGLKLKTVMNTASVMRGYGDSVPLGGNYAEKIPQDTDWGNTAQDYIDHYNEYGWRFFVRGHCPAHLWDEVQDYYFANIVRIAA